MAASADGCVWFVVNSGSGSGQAPTFAARAARELSANRVQSRLIVTTSPEQALLTTAEAVRDDARAVVACGGDGTVHSVIAGLAGTSTPLAILPSGSGDDIASCLGFTASGESLVTRLQCESRRVDLGVTTCDTGESGYFLGVMSCGFDSAVNERANRLPRLAGQRYHVAMVQELATFKPIEYTVTVDGRSQEIEGMLIAVGNGDRYGGGMLVCPDAKIDDGLLTVTVLHAMPRRTFIRLFPRVYQGSHVDHPLVSVLEGASIRVAARGATAYADGERVGPLPLVTSIAPGALTILGNP